MNLAIGIALVASKGNNMFFILAFFAILALIWACDIDHNKRNNAQIQHLRNQLECAERTGADAQVIANIKQRIKQFGG